MAARSGQWGRLGTALAQHGARSSAWCSVIIFIMAVCESQTALDYFTKTDLRQLMGFCNMRCSGLSMLLVVSLTYLEHLQRLKLSQILGRPKHSL